jgi:hypothetical protein
MTHCVSDVVVSDVRDDQGGRRKEEARRRKERAASSKQQGSRAQHHLTFFLHLGRNQRQGRETADVVLARQKCSTVRRSPTTLAMATMSKSTGITISGILACSRLSARAREGRASPAAPLCDHALLHHRSLSILSNRKPLFWLERIGTSQTSLLTRNCKLFVLPFGLTPRMRRTHRSGRHVGCQGVDR